MEKLLNTTVYSALWSMARVLFTTGLNFLTTLVLAWFLAPADFALIAMTVVFVQLSAFLVDSGFSDALIRKTQITDTEKDSIFYLSLLIAVVIYGLIFLAAPLVSDFYSQPILIDIIRIIMLSVFFKALVVVPNVLLTRELSFKKLFWINLPATVLASALCIYLAYHGSGVWALVWQPVTYAVLSAVITLTVIDWRPGLKFSFTCIKDLFGFSFYLLINRLLNIPFNNMYLIVLPKVFSPTLVGLYFFAQKIKEVLVDLLVSSVEKVTYSAFAKLQDDEELLHEAYRRLVRTTTFVSFGFLVLCILLAPALYQYALPEDWLPGLLVMQLFCLSALFFAPAFCESQYFKDPQAS